MTVYYYQPPYLYDIQRLWMGEMANGSRSQMGNAHTGNICRCLFFPSVDFLVAAAAAFCVFLFFTSFHHFIWRAIFYSCSRYIRPPFRQTGKEFNRVRKEKKKQTWNTRWVNVSCASGRLYKRHCHFFYYSGKICHNGILAVSRTWVVSMHFCGIVSRFTWCPGSAVLQLRTTTKKPQPKNAWNSNERNIRKWRILSGI